MTITQCKALEDEISFTTRAAVVEGRREAMIETLQWVLSSNPIPERIQQEIDLLEACSLSQNPPPKRSFECGGMDTPYEPPRP